MIGLVRCLWVALTVALAIAAAACHAGPPQLRIPDEPVGTPGAGVPANVLVNLSLTFEDAGAAFRAPYQPVTRYDGYFNPALCYTYPMLDKPGIGPVPDLGENGYFRPAGAAGPAHVCAGAFSGNFLNWATMSTLDLLRIGLTGGDRVVDRSSHTVLQRAWLPDGKFNLDFQAHPQYFPRKQIGSGPDSGAPAQVTPPQVTPFALERLFIASCRDRVYFSRTDQASGCALALAQPSERLLGEFNVRVEVCGAQDSAMRPDLCKPYGKGFKPEGALQQASERIGVMGYLSEHPGPTQYGGVLRSPLKLLRPDSETDSAEWSARTGVLNANPDATAQGGSGAIRYVNLIGRSNPARLGAYTTADPGAELFYEALRYLQGRDGTVADGGAVDDRLPVWGTRADPVLSPCQRNVIATIGHAAFIDDRFVPGNTRTDHHDASRPPDSFGSPFDVMQATRTVGALEGVNGTTPLDLLGAGADGAGSYYIAGAAWWAHTRPVRPDHPWMRVDSYSLELGRPSGPPDSPLYYAAKFGAFNDRNKDGDPGVTANGRRDASEWSADGKRPDHYHPAPDGHAVVGAVRELFAHTGQGTRRLGGAVAWGTGAGSDSRFIIQAGYDLGAGSGSLQRYAVQANKDGVVLANQPAWDANVLLTGQQDAAGPAAPQVTPAMRKIYTLAYRDDHASVLVPWHWSALPDDIRAWLDRSGPGGMPDGRGEQRVQWLRGERGAEGEGGLRKRTGVLGDIVHSTPLIVGPPSAAIQGDGYGAFRARFKARASVVFVGANDGMLHAFDAMSGRELFAYIPHALLPSVSLLAQPGYRHRPYVDGSPAQGEAIVNGQWRTVLASGMGMGARGVFALDISDPANFAGGAGALWEFTDADDAAMGHLRAPPAIAKLTVAVRGGVPLYRYFVVVGSGINPRGGAGNGALFLLALDKAPGERWKLNVNYFKIVAPVADEAQPNALAPPALAIAGDGSVRYAYAGDLQGNLWRFDLSGKPPWGGALRAPLFVARDDDKRRQPITHAPRLSFAPGGGYLVSFGTGKYLEPQDDGPASFATQSFYTVHDRLADPVRTLAGRSALAVRTLSGNGPFALHGKPVAYADGQGDGAADAGWYFDLPGGPEQGERMVAQPQLRSGALIFDSIIPGGASCSGPASRSYLVDVLSGLAIGNAGEARQDAVTGEWSPPSEDELSAATFAPILFETGSARGAPTATGAVSVLRTFTLVRPGRGVDGADSAQVHQRKVKLTAGRLSWRDIANWLDQRNAARRKER
ncbi:MAG: pilus assembly protein [Gammaproteobacteria bacterium]